MKGLDDEVALKEQDNTIPKPASQFTLPTGYLSPSQINTYQRCPKQYEFRYILGDITPPGFAMVMGLSVHAALESAHKQRLDSGEYPETEAVLDTYSSRWGGIVDEYELEVKTPTPLPDVINGKDIGYSLVGKYMRTRANAVVPVAVEKRITADINGIPVIGYIDLIDAVGPGYLPTDGEPCTCESTEAKQGCANYLLCNQRSEERVVSDLKVVSKTKSQVECDNDLQLTAYAHAEGLRNVRFDSLVKSVISPKISTVSSRRTEQDFSWYKQVVEGVAKGVSSGYFPPCSPSNWACSATWCGYWSKCRGKKR